MTEQQNHLKTLLSRRLELNNEINKLNNEVAAKREMFLKVQGVIEYLSETGVTLPENEESTQEEEPEIKQTTVVE
jgi:hypothetical protein